MRIDGAGGCFDNRIYELDADVVWQIALLVAGELGINIESRDDEERLLNGLIGEKLINICVQKMDAETCQVFVDTRKKILQVYSWKPEEKEVNAFYESFEKKLKEYAAFILCPQCKAKISSSAKFCPECGYPVK